MRRYRIHCYWVAVCVGIHTFAMDCEAEEKVAATDYDDELGFDDDPFIVKGLFSESESSDDGGDVAAAHSSGRAVGLHAAKAHHEGLKWKLFDAKMKKAWQRCAECILSH